MQEKTWPFCTLETSRGDKTRNEQEIASGYADRADSNFRGNGPHPEETRESKHWRIKTVWALAYGVRDRKHASPGNGLSHDRPL